MFKVRFTEQSKDQLLHLKKDKSKKNQFKAVGKIIGLMEINLRHHSLNTHKFSGIESPFGGDVFESYAQNKTPGAYRIFWVYGPHKGEITILAITKHP